MAAMKLAVPRSRALVGVILYGALIFGGAFSFAYYALVRIHAGLGQTLLALVPLATLLLAVLQRQERLRAAAVAGTLLSVAGIAVVSGLSGTESVPPLSLLAVVGAVLCFAEATVLLRRFPPVHPVATNTVGMVVGAAILVALSLLFGSRLPCPHAARPGSPSRTWSCSAPAQCSCSTSWSFDFWGAARAAYTFVVIPLVTVLLSVDRRRADRRGTRPRRPAGARRGVHRCTSPGYERSSAGDGSGPRKRARPDGERPACGSGL